MYIYELKHAPQKVNGHAILYKSGDVKMLIVSETLSATVEITLLK